MKRYVISYRMFMSDEEVIFVDFDDSRAVYVNDNSFFDAITAAISLLADHITAHGYYDFEICGIKRIFDI